MTTRILVVDRSEALANSARQAVRELHGGHDVVFCSRLSELGDVIAADGPFDILLAGSSLVTRTGLARLEAAHDRFPAMALVLVWPPNPDVHVRDLVRSGASDLVGLPVRVPDLVDALGRAIERRRLLDEAADPVVVTAAGGVTFTVASATGGCGKTFYATNLAYFLAQHTGKRVCIADFDLQFGEVTTALRLRPRYTSYDLLERPGNSSDDRDDTLLETHIDEYCVQHDSGVWVLAAPKEPSEADRFTSRDITRIIEALQRRFDYVILDTPAQLSEVVLACFDRSHLTFVLATLDLPSVRNMGVFLTTLQRLKIPSDDVRLILNKAESGVGIEVDQVTKLFPQGFSSVLPYAKEVSRSINLGMPVLGASPASEVSRKLAAGMANLLPEGSSAIGGLSEAKHARRGLFRRAPRPAVAGSAS
jgi:pilus assembly protein CpaE